MHLMAAEAFGATSEGNMVKSSGLIGATVDFDKKSVGATVNALIMASVAKGKSHIHGCAREPHIDSLIDFLRSSGAEIDVSGDSVSVTGKELTGGSISARRYD
jgi:UDP-N-acetylglucosamine 1-carboxyvinyltransferase